ncbi:MAG: hypothetical protein H7844_10395 [Nitrospirae bacterium YQR-1]
MVLSTDSLLKGKNPYDFVNQPMYLNHYGIVYNYMVIPIHKLIKIIYPAVNGALILSHRMTSALFIVLSLALFALVMYAQRHKIIYVYGAVIVQYVSLLLFSTPLSKPDATGTFLYLLSVFIPWRFNFSAAAVIISIILGISGFYTKMYFVIGTVIVISYVVLFISKKTGLIYAAYFGVSFIVSALIINYMYESYFYDVLILHLYNNPLRIDMMIKQSAWFMLCNFGLVMYLLISLSNNRSYADVFKYFRDMNFLNMGDPVFANKIDLFSYAALITFLMLELRLACNASWMTYYFQLFLPFFLLTVLNIKIDFLKSATLLAALLSLNIYSSYSFCLYSKLITPLTFVMDLPSKRFRSAGLKNHWKFINKLVEANRNVLVSKHFNFVVFNIGGRVYDTGINSYLDSTIPKSRLLKKFFPANLQQRNKNFVNDINNKISEKYFDLLILTYSKGEGAERIFFIPWYIHDVTLFSSYDKSGHYFSTEQLANYEFMVFTPKK